MGASQSHDPKAIPKNAVCVKEMLAYEKCVENHKDGLTEGDDCSDEANLYKNCFKEIQAQKKAAAAVAASGSSGGSK